MPASIQHGRSANHTLADCLPERPSRFRADQDRQLSHRLPLRAGSDLRRFRVVRCRAGAARRGHLVEPAAMAGGRSRDDAAGVTTPRRADDRRLGRGHRHATAGSICLSGLSGNLPRSMGWPGFASAISIPRSSKDALRRRIVAGDTIAGLDGRPPLDLATLDATERVVAVAGIHPYIKLLDEGADVIIGGRSSDCAIFAAPAIRRGFPEGARLFLRQGARMRLVLRRALWRQGIGARRDHDG